MTKLESATLRQRVVLAAKRALLLMQFCIERDPAKRRVLRWWFDDPGEERRYAYQLQPDSVVWDIGGYLGEWTREIVRRYDPHVDVFEPVPSFAAELERQFAHESKVRIHAFGLADRDDVQAIMQSDDASSLFISEGSPVVASFRDVAGFFDEEGFEEVTLMKINIEGGEYQLLRRMIEADLIRRFCNIQVQFHDFVADAEENRADIRDALARTHVLTYDYPFIWENWRRV